MGDEERVVIREVETWRGVAWGEEVLDLEGVRGMRRGLLGGGIAL